MATSMKERWAKCELLAAKLKIAKDEVFACLSVLEDRKLVDRILADDASAILEAQGIDRYGRPRRLETVTTTRLVYPEPRTALEAKAADVRIMLWAVNKIGDKERARKAFEDVMQTLTDT